MCIRELGLNAVGGLQFVLDDRDVYVAQAREEAMKKVRERAIDLKKSLGVEILGIASYNEYEDGARQPYPYMMDSIGAGAKEAAADEPGAETDARDLVPPVILPQIALADAAVESGAVGGDDDADGIDDSFVGAGHHFGSDARHIGAGLIQGQHQPRQRALGQHRVGVEREHIGLVDLLQPAVDGRGEAEILTHMHDLNLGEIRLRLIDDTVIRGIVDDDYPAGNL